MPSPTQNEGSEKNLSEEQKVNLSTALEHLAVVGSHFRMEDWRQEEYAKHKKEDDNDDDEVHAEDCRIYGEIQWPNKRRKVVAARQDKEWNVEHGDDINPLIFAQTKLTGQRLPPEEISKLAAMETHSTENVTVAPQDATRALLLRCWERAMTAASSTVGIGHRKRHLTRRKACPEMDWAPPDMTRAGAQDKCRAMGIELPQDDDNGIVACPCCSIEFESKEKLKDHFYGDDSVEGGGCCWLEIRKRQQAMIERILEAEVGNQVENLISLFFEGQQAAVETDDAKPRDWEFVLATLKRKIPDFIHTKILGGFKGKRPKNSEACQTVLVDKERPPLVFNAQVYRMAENKVLQRYAKVPK